VMVAKEIHRRRNKEGLDWWTAILEDRIFYLLGVAITQITLTAVIFWNHWPREFWIFQYLSWLLISKFLVEQLEINHSPKHVSRLENGASNPTRSFHNEQGVRPCDEETSLKRSSDKSRLVYPNPATPWSELTDKNDLPIADITLHTHSTNS
ncbi:hypothetical protein K7432_015787, partial [Basidiobolus ranarum]